MPHVDREGLRQPAVTLGRSGRWSQL